MTRNSLLSVFADFERFASGRAIVYSRGYRHSSWTYETLAARAALFANALRSRGIRSNDRILLWAANSGEWVAAVVADTRALAEDAAEAVVADSVDLVFCCGPLMRALWDALPSACQGGYAETSAALEPQVLAAIQPGDSVMVKGSLGSRMGPIVKALASSYRRAPVASGQT